MPSDEDEKSADQQASQNIIDALERSAEVRSMSNPDPFAGKHLSVVALGMWADGEKPENFLAEYAISNSDHVSQCETCQKNIVYFNVRRQKK